MKDQKIDAQGRHLVSKIRTLFVIGVVVSLPFLCLTFGCNKSKDTELTKNAREREENRARKLEEAINALNLPQVEQGTKELRDGLKDLNHKIPEGSSYMDQLTICVGFLEQINKAAAEGSLKDIPPIAAQGLMKTKIIIAELAAKGKEEAEESRNAAKSLNLSKASLALNKSQVYLAIAQTFKVALIPFQAIIGHYVLNGSKDLRLETFELIANGYSAVNAVNPEGASTLKEMMQQGYTEEDNVDNKARMEQMIGQLNIPLKPDQK